MRAATLSCGVRKIDIPVSVAMHLAQLGDAHEAYLTKVCKRPPTSKPKSALAREGD